MAARKPPAILSLPLCGGCRDGETITVGNPPPARMRLPGHGRSDWGDYRLAGAELGEILAAGHGARLEIDESREGCAPPPPHVYSDPRKPISPSKGGPPVTKNPVPNPAPPAEMP